MASQSASQDVDDQRFAELLKPIKDLTQNWQVPLADLLSTYIEDLKHVTITFDGGETSVNFAEAALLLQGTASVYGKKVDFLWQMVLQTLDMLRSKKEADGEEGDAEGEGGPTQKGRKKNQLDTTREFGLLEAELGKNIDVKNEEESLEERKNALNFIYITPRQLIEKEGSEQKAVKVNLYMGVQQGKWDILAGKEDFRINSQYVSVTGGLGEDLTVDNQYLSVSIDQDYEEDLTLPPASPEQEPPPLATSIFTPAETDDPHNPIAPDPDMSLGNVSHNSIRADGQHDSTPTTGDCIASVLSPQTVLDKTPEPEVDPWAPLDPYQDMSTPRPMKPKKTIRLPPSLTTKHDKTKPLPPIEQYLMQEMTDSLYNPAMLPNVPPAFYDLAVLEMSRRRAREKEERRKRLAEVPGVRREVIYDQEHYEEGGQDIFDQVDDMPEDDDDDGIEIPDNFQDDLPNPHLGGDVGSFVVENIGTDGVAESETGDSYEELVARRVQEFVHKSQEFLKSSELTQRVAKWHQMIGPRLDRVEQRKAFDVHLYGSRVLSSFDDLPETSKESCYVPFNTVVRGQKGEEVARYFLSTLMLANTMNVGVSTEPGTDPQLGMDNVRLKLLSSMRHHEQLADFQAASQAESAEMVAGVEIGGVDPDVVREEGPTRAKRPKKAAKKKKNEAELESDDEESEEEFRKPKVPAKKGKKK